MLKADLSELPRATATKDVAVQADREPRFGQVLAETWAASDRFATELPRAKQGARFRHSDALNCARAVAYAALDVPACDRLDLSAVFVMNLGHIVHDAWQEVMAARFGAEAEVKVGSGERAGHIDSVVRMDGKTIALEAKTVGGFAYKMAVGERGPAQGPKRAHIVQGALNAIEVDADELVIVYWSKDAISVNVAARKKFTELERFTSEWTFTRDEFEPLAREEQARVDGILALLDEGVLPARMIPELPRGAKITDPATGRWEQSRDGKLVDTGSAWNCGYCRWQTACQATSPDRQPVAEVAVALGVAS